jgi:maltooligosyltrehalose trehalohydrolase
VTDSRTVVAQLSGPDLGAVPMGEGRCLFRVWAPFHDRVDLHLVAPEERRVPLTRAGRGYHEAVVDRVEPGARYVFAFGEQERPDPASRLQPEGVHGPSEVVEHDFAWNDDGWKGIPLEHFVVYELHIGTFTEGGTLDDAIVRLDDLRDLGITAVELMPLAQFPGDRNWGYDGAYPNAVQFSYGGPPALKRFVDACHARGLAVILDVVYNHLGPEGNYLGDYGPYFTDRYKTPWGMAINFDGPQSDCVRWFFIHNALQWIGEFHVDALRIDAVHAIVDPSAEPFLSDLTGAVRARGDSLGRRVYTIAESDLNDPRIITPRDDHGLGFDSQWSDDFHHSLHTILTGESHGYYEGLGKVSDLARVLTSGYRWTGEYNGFRGRKYGRAPKTRNGAQFVVCAQNHDQIGNRMLGERLSTLIPREALPLVAATVVLAPFIPMLFMGEEYGETAPFPYFTSHFDPDLIEGVRRGRREEHHTPGLQGEPPDPQDEATFLRAKLNRSLLESKEQVSLRRIYGDLLRLRRETLALRSLDLNAVETLADDANRTLLVRRQNTLLALNFSDRVQHVRLPWPDRWIAMIDTGARVDGETLTMRALNFALFYVSGSGQRGPRPLAGVVRVVGVPF